MVGNSNVNGFMGVMPVAFWVSDILLGSPERRTKNQKIWSRSNWGCSQLKEKTASRRVPAVVSLVAPILELFSTGMAAMCNYFLTHNRRW